MSRNDLTARPAARRLRVLPAAFTATTVYEFRMAVRGRMLWLSVLPLLAVALLIMLTSPSTSGQDTTMAKIAGWAVLANLITTVGVGVALADRFQRLRELGLTELLTTTPASVTWRMAGTVLGALAAALAPVAVALLLVSAVAGFAEGSPAAPVWGVLAVLGIVLPGALLLTVFAATLALFLPLPLARFLAVLVWFWATVFNTRMIPLPTPTGTLFSPLGDYAGAGWMQADVLWAGRSAWDALSPEPAALSALWNVVVLLALSAVLFLVARSTASARR